MDNNGYQTSSAATGITSTSVLTVLEAEDTEINDSNVVLASNNNLTDAITSSLSVKYNNSGVKYAGLVRSSANGEFYLVKDASAIESTTDPTALTLGTLNSFGSGTGTAGDAHALITDSSDPHGTLTGAATTVTGTLDVTGATTANAGLGVFGVLVASEVAARFGSTLTLRSENNACQILIANSQITNSCQTTINGPLIVNGDLDIVGGTTTGVTKAMVGLDQVDNKSAATILDNPSMTGLTTVNTFKIGADGNEAAPSVYWGLDTDTGFSHTPGVVCVSAEGTNTACFRTTGLQITQGNISFLLPGGTVDTRVVSADGATLDNLNATLGLGSLTTAEVNQLRNIDTSTISAAQWGYLGATDQGLAITDTPTFAGINTTGLIDTRDVAADGAMLVNLNTTLGLGSLTTAEVNQLRNIDTSTISAAQWGYLGATDQGLATTDTPAFAGIITGGDVDGVDVSDLETTVGNLLTDSDLTMTDNIANAFTLKEGVNEYVTIDTTDASELITMDTANVLINQDLNVIGSLQKNGIVGHLLEEIIDNTNLVAGAGVGTSFTSASNVLCIGNAAGGSITTGDDNVCIGKDAGGSLTTQGSNVIIGSSAGANTNSTHNTLIGMEAHYSTVSAPSAPNNCTALGYRAGGAVGGNYNTSIGAQAMGGTQTSRTSTSNTAVGYQAMMNMQSGVGNVAMGYQAGNSLASAAGNYGVFIGFDAGVTATKASYNTYIGGNSGNLITDGVYNTMLGGQSRGLSSGNYQISLGYMALCSASNQMTIGGVLAADKITEVRPGSTDKTCDLGSSTNRFGTVYCDNLDPEGTISVSISGPISASQGVVAQFSRVSTGSAVTMTLPTATGIDGLEYHIHHVAGTSPLTIDTTSSQTIRFTDGTTSTSHISYHFGGTYSFMAVNGVWVMRSATPMVVGELSNTGGMVAANGVDKVIEFDTKGVEYGTTVAIDTTNRITVKYSGRYQITGTFSIRSDSTVAVRDILIFANKNLATVLSNCTSGCALEGLPSTDYQTISFSGIVDLVADDYIQAKFTDNATGGKMELDYGTLSVVGLSGQW
jgi:hypothetical protein